MYTFGVSSFELYKIVHYNNPVHTHVHTHAHTYTYIHTHVQTHTHTSAHTVPTPTHTHTHTHTHSIASKLYMQLIYLSTVGPFKDKIGNIYISMD